MYRKNFVAGIVIVMLTLVYPLALVAQTAAPAGKQAAPKAATANSTSGKKATSAPIAAHSFTNSVAVCGCGKVFTPDSNTKTFSVDGKEYACCSEECHKKLAGMTPADAAKLCDTQVAKLEAPLGAAVTH